MKIGSSALLMNQEQGLHARGRSQEALRLEIYINLPTIGHMCGSSFIPAVSS